MDDVKASQSTQRVRRSTKVSSGKNVVPVVLRKAAAECTPRGAQGLTPDAMDDMDLERICRTCLASDGDMYPVFSGVSGSRAYIGDMVATCTRIKVEEGDGLPLLICCKCIERVLVAFSFKMQAEKADALLRSRISKKQFENSNKSTSEEKLCKSFDDRMENSTDNVHINSDESDDDNTPLKDLKAISIKKNDLNSYKKVKKHVPRNTSGKENMDSINLEPRQHKYHSAKETDLQEISSSGEKTKLDVFVKKRPKRSIKCKMCNKVFTNEALLAKHKCSQCESPSNCKPFKCRSCKMRFTLNIALNMHILRHHKGKSLSVNFIKPIIQKKKRFFICQSCNKKFYRKKHLEKHCIKVHMPQVFECDICQKRFNSRSYFRSHLRMHDTNKEKLNCCEYCGLSCACPSQLIVHMRSHTGEKPYKCSVCGDRFSQRSNLSTHRRKKGHYDDSSQTLIPADSVNNPNKNIKANFDPLAECSSATDN